MTPRWLLALLLTSATTAGMPQAHGAEGNTTVVVEAMARGGPAAALPIPAAVAVATAAAPALQRGPDPRGAAAPLRRPLPPAATTGARACAAAADPPAGPACRLAGPATLCNPPPVLA
jgi:alkylation response protein AidB-like acyl-CoA dehydrogenase